MSNCINREYLEEITDYEPIVQPDINGEAEIVGSQEVLMGNWCHLRKEYNVDCETCEYRSDEE